jgi:multidrug resistance efflux pump
MADPLLTRRVIVSLVGIGVLLAVGMMIFKVLGRTPPPPAQAETVARPIAVRTVTLRRGDYRERLTGYGRASALRTTVVAAEVPGIVEWIADGLEAGATVEADAELVRLDDHDLQQALAQATAREQASRAERTRLDSELETARARLRWAKDEVAASRRELERLKGLIASKAVTQSDVDRQSIQTSLREATFLQIDGQIKSLQAQLDRNTANLAEAAAAVKRARKDLARAVVRAPYSGRVVTRTARRGARVAPGAPLFELVDTGVVEVAVALPSARYGLVEPGASAKVRLSADDPRAFDCKVARIAPVVDTNERTFFVYLEMRDGEVPPGAFVVAEIEGPVLKGVFTLPRTAFVGDQVFVAVDGKARARTPTARLTLPHVMLAESGVADGDELITTNLEEVADGTRIAPTGTPAKEKDS